jgi:hypothetical protein
MFQQRQRAVFSSLALGALLFFSSSSAHAAPPGAGEMSEEKLEAAEEGEAPEKIARLHVWADNVIGIGRTPVIETDAIRLGGAPLVHHLNDVRFQSQNFDIGVSYEFINDLAIGIEFPLTHITYNSSLSTRSVTSIGNFELNAEYAKIIAKHLELVPSLEIALPTAQGDELPTKEEVDADPGKSRELTPLDRFAAQRAAAAARGWEENHLFAPQRLGIVPRIGLLWEIGHLELEPYAKFGALVSTNKKPFEGDFVFALRAAYRFHKFFDGGVRVWTNIPVGGSLPEDESPIGVLEPQLRGHFGAFLPVFGVVLPFVGPLSHPENVGIRFAIAAHF